MMSEEDLHRPSDQTNFKVEVNWQVQVQVLVQYICTAMHGLRLKLCGVKYIVAVVYVRLRIFIRSIVSIGILLDFS